MSAALGALFANRLPDVELLTAGGRGIPMLAASYATERNLTLTALGADRRSWADAEGWSAARDVRQAHSSKIGWQTHIGFG